MKKPVKMKLSLNLESVRQLTSVETSQIVGGTQVSAGRGPCFQD